MTRGDYAAALGGCKRAGGPDRKLLVALAEALLERDARSLDAQTQRGAFVQLGFAGKNARAVLSRLAAKSEPRSLRAPALSALTRLGDKDARAELRLLSSAPEAQVVDLAFAALDPARDHERLLAALLSPRQERRLAALAALGKAAPSTQVRLALAEAARLDPVPEGRVAALFALQAQGAEASDAVFTALDAENSSVRLAAIAVLARVDPARALTRLPDYLGAAPSQESLVAALALLQLTAAVENARAMQALSRALEADDAALRMRVAVLLRAIKPNLRDQAATRARLEKEPVAEVRLLLALALGTADPAAQASLRALAAGKDVVAVEALRELAALDPVSTRQQLGALLGSDNPQVRADAARALAQLHHLPELCGLLADPDANVRRAAAGAVLAAAA